MEVIIVIVSFIGWLTSGFDFTTLHFYISLAFSLWKCIRRYTNDKTAKR